MIPLRLAVPRIPARLFLQQEIAWVRQYATSTPRTRYFTIRPWAHLQISFDLNYAPKKLVKAILVPWLIGEWR